MQLPSGATIVYGYNANGQVSSVSLDGSTTILSGITYDPFGPITGWTWGNGTTASRGFDTDGKITQVDNANGASLKNYSYDNAFRITGIADALDSSLSWTYGYDSLDRLNSASKTGTTQGWTYDANGNRLTETGSSPSTYTNSTTSNRLNSTSGSLSRSYSYDNAGNTLGYGTATFTYNNRGRMKTGHCWKLSGCMAALNIEVRMRPDLTWPPAKRVAEGFEREHVDDFLAGVAYLQQLGELRQDEQRNHTFTSKEACESQTAAAVARTLNMGLATLKKNTIYKRDMPDGGHKLRWYHYIGRPF